LRILLDENLPWPFGELLVGHTYDTVIRAGWSGVKNGRLLTLAQTQFDIFLTMDRGIPFQQNLNKYLVAVFLLRAASNDLADLRPLAGLVLKAAKTPKKGACTIIEL
jgi:hypothetical protein